MPRKFVQAIVVCTKLVFLLGILEHARQRAPLRPVSNKMPCAQGLQGASVVDRMARDFLARGIKYILSDSPGRWLEAWA